MTEVITMAGPGVVVGFDGSAASARAVEWAVGEARIRGVPLTVCHAWDVPALPLTPAEVEPARQAAKRILERGIAVAAGCHGPPVPLASRLLAGPAAPALVYAADRADVLVMGARGAGSCAWLGLGSVSSQLTTHAHCPVEVVRGDGSWRGHGIVVGVDGSASSEGAVRFAFEEASLRGMPLTAVCSWWEPMMPAIPYGTDALFNAHAVLDISEMRHDVKARAELVTDRWRDKYPDVTFTSSVAKEPPRNAVLAAAGRAALLVVGARGLGGFPGMLLGSVSQAMVDHAPCPVAVIRSE